MSSSSQYYDPIENENTADAFAAGGVTETDLELEREAAMDVMASPVHKSRKRRTVDDENEDEVEQPKPKSKKGKKASAKDRTPATPMNSPQPKFNGKPKKTLRTDLDEAVAEAEAEDTPKTPVSEHDVDHPPPLMEEFDAKEDPIQSPPRELSKPQSSSSSSSSTAPAPLVPTVRKLRPEDFLKQECGRDGLKIYFEDVNPDLSFEISIYEVGQDEKARIVRSKQEYREAQKRLGKWSDQNEKNFEETMRFSHLIGRYPSFKPKKGIFQLEREIIHDEDGNVVYKKDPMTGKDKKTYGKQLFFGTRLLSNATGLIMSPMMVTGRLQLNAVGNLNGGGQFDPKDIKMAQHGFCITDMPINEPGYDDGSSDHFNPFAQKFFDFVKEDLTKSIYRQIWTHSDFAKDIKTKTKNAAIGDLKAQLAKEKKYKTVEEAEKIIKDRGDAFKNQAEMEKARSKLLDIKRFENAGEVETFLKTMEGMTLLKEREDWYFERDNHRKALVAYEKNAHPDLGRPPSVMYFKRSIFKREFNKDKQSEIRARIRNNYYNHLPQELRDEIVKADGELEYDGLLVFRMKTAEDLAAQGNWKAHPFPMRELNWDERAKLVGKQVCAAVVAQVELSEQQGGRCGPTQMTPVAVVIFPRCQPKFEINSDAARRERQEMPYCMD